MKKFREISNVNNWEQPEICRYLELYPTKEFKIILSMSPEIVSQVTFSLHMVSCEGTITCFCVHLQFIFMFDNSAQDFFVSNQAENA